MSAGYSGTPLGKKLGYGDLTPVYAVGMPDDVQAEITDFAPQITWSEDVATAGAAHGFFTERTKQEAFLAATRRGVSDTGMVWASWPKKASKVETDITEDVVRDVALPLGFVDVKVCAVDQIWSGLKLVVRKELRESAKP